MEIRDKVKLRRMERVRELKESEADSQWARKMEDPEFAWHQKYKSEAARIARELEEGDGGSWLAPPTSRRIWTKIIASGLLLAAIWGLSRLDQPWANKATILVKTSLTQSFDFHAAAVWYEKRFGSSPAFIPGFRGRDQRDDAVKVNSSKRSYFAPVSGKVVKGFDPFHSGVMLETKEGAPIYALDTGQVIFIGHKEETGNTIIIRHPGGLDSVYGRIGETLVEANDWIKGGEAIGKASYGEGSKAGELYFGVMKDGRALNPLDVISFD